MVFRIRGFCAAALAAGIIWVTDTVSAHHVRDPMPANLAERLITVIEDARDAGMFQSTALPDGCGPQACLTALLMSLDQADMRWLAQAPEAEIPSSYFGRLPASVTWRFLTDLILILPNVDAKGPLGDQARRLQEVLIKWPN